MHTCMGQRRAFHGLQDSRGFKLLHLFSFPPCPSELLLSAGGGLGGVMFYVYLFSCSHC